MFTPSTLLQYVRDVATSATFYSGILGKPPVEQSPGFALFLLGDGAALGLWQRDGCLLYTSPSPRDRG